MESDLNEWEKCSVAGVQVVEVLPCQKLDLVDTRLEIRPLRACYSEMRCSRVVQRRVDNPILDPTVVVCFTHGKWCFWQLEVVRTFTRLLCDEWGDVVDGAGNTLGWLSQACVQDMAGNWIDRHELGTLGGNKSWQIGGIYRCR